MCRPVDDRPATDPQNGTTGMQIARLTADDKNPETQARNVAQSMRDRGMIVHEHAIWMAERRLETAMCNTHLASLIESDPQGMVQRCRLERFDVHGCTFVRLFAGEEVAEIWQRSNGKWTLRYSSRESDAVFAPRIRVLEESDLQKHLASLFV